MDKENWDWQTPVKQIPIKEWQDRYNWMEAPCVSPDGEHIAAIVNLDEACFGVCDNGQTWDETFEKAWSLKYAPNGTLSALVSKDEEWTVCLDGTLWDTWFDFIWDLQTSSDGVYIGAAVQKDMAYGMAVNDKVWENMYDNITGAILSDQGNSAAIVQVEKLGQADIDKFSQGVFSAAIEGLAYPSRFMNVWDLTFDRRGIQIAYAIRKNRTDYSLVNGNEAWGRNFQAVWKPEFFNQDSAIVAPVKLDGKWYLFKDGHAFWDQPFAQLWKLVIHDASNQIAAIVSNAFGKWTLCVNGKTWPFHCNNMIWDPFFSSDGKKLMALFKHNNTWDVVVNGHSWQLKADKLWRPALSANNDIIATRMEKNGRYFLIVNKKIFHRSFDMIFEPQISPENDKILLKSIQDGIYKRQILKINTII